MTTSKPEIIVDGEWLSALMPWGDLEWVTCWPGGTESITFDVARHHRAFRPDALVELDYGGMRLAAGALMEPTRGEPLRAEGLFRKAEDFAALDSSGAASVNVNDAIDQAIARGLPWAGRAGDFNPVPGVTGMPLVDADRVHSVREFLEASMTQRALGYGVSGDRMLAFVPPDHLASLHMLPGVDGLGISLDGYASALIGRFLNSFDNIYYTVRREDEAATKRWGYKEHTIAEPLGGGAPMMTSDAEQILDGLLAQGRSKIGWTKPLEVQHGDVVTEYGRPFDLNRLVGGHVIRLHDLHHDLADLAGGTTADLRAARTRHNGATVLLEPVGLSTPMADALAGLNA